MWFAILHSKYIHTCIFIYISIYIYIDIVNNYEQIQIYCILRQAFNWFIYKLDLFIHIKSNKMKKTKRTKKKSKQKYKKCKQIFLHRSFVFRITYDKLVATPATPRPHTQFDHNPEKCALIIPINTHTHTHIGCSFLMP